MIITFERLVQILDGMADLPNQGVPARQALAIKFHDIGPGEIKDNALYDTAKGTLVVDLDANGECPSIEIC